MVLQADGVIVATCSIGVVQPMCGIVVVMCVSAHLVRVIVTRRAETSIGSVSEANRARSPLRDAPLHTGDGIPCSERMGFARSTVHKPLS